MYTHINKPKNNDGNSTKDAESNSGKKLMIIAGMLQTIAMRKTTAVIIIKFC